ncbi:MAG: RagB/SusD family nutrient uptake outer membrane protein [Muribaculaceae bacterium]|nr:RagB/SusD family nutrient uptake outer membrane protein [Muribaculaceae bacterium]
MKKPTVFLKSFLLLVAMSCIAISAWSQGFDREATCGEEETSSILSLRSPALVPMSARAGDVNVDGRITIDDVTALIDMLLKGTTGVTSADANQDGSVSIDDVTELIDMLLKGTTDYDVTDAQNSLNEIYRSMRIAGWSTTGNTHHSFGISANTLAAEVMGDDMIMGAMGNGWFWYDASYTVKSRYTSTGWRSYDLWNAHYTWIGNANYVLEATQSMTSASANYIKGQAYAIRAYSYFMLAQWFARTYKGHESDLCVPIYDGTVFNWSTGLHRATVAQVYAQIDADINQAINLLNGTTQQAPDHIGYAVAQGLKARIALVKEDWVTAYNSAVSAINASGKSIQEVSSFRGLNDAHAGNVMWGADIPTDEVGMYASLWSHMMSNAAYGQRAPKQISNWLYNKISANDTRRVWWKTNTTGVGTDAMVQDKFYTVEGTEWDGDYIWMRVEEMYLTAAEAACHRGQTTTARNYLNQLMTKRVSGYSCTKSGSTLGALTTDETGSLLEEILVQRRIELWGEDARILTIRRLRQGFERTEENGWPAQLQLASRSLTDPESYPWVMTIPYTEFAELYDAGAMNFNQEQNPVDDYAPEQASGPQNVSFLQATQTTQTAMSNLSVTVKVKRAKSQGDYTAFVVPTIASDMAEHVSSGRMVHFNDGESESSMTVSFSGMELNKSYYIDLKFSDADIANSSPSLGTTITSTRVIVQCKNGNPNGQNIRFESSEYNFEYSLTTTSSDVPVVIKRDASADAYGVGITISESSGQALIYSESVFFEVGETSKTVWVSISGLSVLESSYCVVKLVPLDGSASDPAIGTPNTTRITLTREKSNFETIGYCIYESDISDPLSPVLQYDSETSTYRMLDMFGDGYDVCFTIDDDGKVYIQEQPCFDYEPGATAYMVGNYDGNKSGYAGLYDSTSKQAALKVYYYVPGLGSFGTLNDKLTMP